VGIYIRYANNEDANIIALINSKSALQGYKGIIPDDILKEKFSYERLRERLLKELTEGTTINCIVYKDDTAVGMQTFARDDDKERDISEIDIWRIYLLPEYWGQNIGREFIDWGTKELKLRGYKKAALWVVEENARARRFYEKSGFTHDGEIRIINVGREIKEYRYIKEL
jgi:GNAT superfamily N-acetyltransferase